MRFLGKYICGIAFGHDMIVAIPSYPISRCNMPVVLSEAALDAFIGLSITKICPLKFGSVGDVHSSLTLAKILALVPARVQPAFLGGMGSAWVVPASSRFLVFPASSRMDFLHRLIRSVSQERFTGWKPVPPPNRLEAGTTTPQEIRLHAASYSGPKLTGCRVPSVVACQFDPHRTHPALVKP
jgi:hypothetical protein